MNSLTLRSWLSEAKEFDCAMSPSFLGFFCHAGALGALQKEKLLENLVGLSGASAGAQCGALIGSGKRVFKDHGNCFELHEDMSSIVGIGDRRWEVLDPSLGFGILKGDGFEKEMGKFLVPRFEDLKIPFACSVFSAWTWKTEILSKGNLPRAVRASCTVPLLLHPTSHEPNFRWLFDGGIYDPSGSCGLQDLPKQPSRSLHFVIDRQILPGLDKKWRKVFGPSEYGASRENIVTVVLHNPPNLLLGRASFDLFGEAIICTARSIIANLDKPLEKGNEPGHNVLHVDVKWDEHLKKIKTE